MGRKKLSGKLKAIKIERENNINFCCIDIQRKMGNATKIITMIT
jgi:hypothetical protein